MKGGYYYDDYYTDDYESSSPDYGSDDVGPVPPVCCVPETVCDSGSYGYGSDDYGGRKMEEEEAVYGEYSVCMTKVVVRISGSI